MAAVVSLCDLTGIAVEPWAEAGYTCYCIDTQHSIRHDIVNETRAGKIHFWWRDVRSFTIADIPEEIAFVSAFPPCTDLASSGARDFQKKGIRLLIEALEVVEACRLFCEYSRAPFYIENPVGRLSSCWRQPDFIFDPCDFAGYEGGEDDLYTKKTCLWTGNGFKMPATKRLEPTQGSKIHKAGRTRDRDRMREATPAGFARAVFEANHIVS